MLIVVFQVYLSSSVCNLYIICNVCLISDQKPDVMYADIGGMDIQKQEVREAVELPLTHFELYKQVCMSVFVSVLSYLQLIDRSLKCCASETGN